MRVALVDPYFVTGMGYQTTGWFNAFVARGHHVRTFCSCYVPTIVRHLYPRPFPEGLTKIGEGEVLRLPARLLPRDIVRCAGLMREVVAFNPELTLAVYPGTLFARDLFVHRDALPGALFSLFGENQAQRRGMSRLKVAALDLAFFMLKRRAYRMFMERSDGILCLTPDTLDFNLNRVAWGRRREEYRAKCVPLALGFDPLHFYPDADARQCERSRLGVADDDVVGLYSCKIDPVKRLDVWVGVMAVAMRRIPRLRAMLIGTREGHAESDRILSLIDKTGYRERFICLPFATREQLPRLYNAADFGVWYLQPSVTIQEAMGTGLYMVLTNGPTVSHLVLDPMTGRYFEEGDFARLADLVAETAEAFVRGEPVSLSASRARRAEVNASRFGYIALADRVVAAARDPANAAAHLALDREGASAMV
jgi:glycosyltransferase involved in cell wall biosynthesis